jgi:uncharacterized membrane protein HdeD (DUF308 family)
MDMTALATALAQVELPAGGLLIAGIISLLAGVLILVVPRVLNYIVAVYLIVIGVLWIIAAL